MKKKIAVLTSGWSADYLISILQGMKKGCESKNADLYVFTSYKSFEASGKANTTGFAIFDLLNPKDYDGIVLMSNLFNDQEHADLEYKKIIESGVPAISINQHLDNLHYVGSDNFEVFKELVSHLIEEHDINDFACIGGPIGNEGADSNLKAFKEALQEHNIPFPNKNVYLDGDWSYNFGYEAAQKIFSNNKKPPKAIVCVNDWAAMAATKVAFDHNYNVPNDVKIIGFDEIPYTTKVIPSITSVNIQSEKMGEEAINVLLEKNKNKVTKIIRAIPHYRQSCGCQKEISKEQIQFSQSYSQKIDGSQRFTSQLRHIEDVFIRNGTVDKLEEALQAYFELRNHFEGQDFAVMIKEEVIKSLSNSDYSYASSTSYGKKMQILIDIEKGKPIKLEGKNKLIPTQKLIPDSMIDSKSSMFLFIPIFNQKYLHGYYVSKNELSLLSDKIAYNWSRNFGASIEKFRQTVNYRLMSERLKILSTTDALTGILNRTGFDTIARDLFNKNNAGNKKTFIMFIDINNMKYINDKHGHLHGDLAIKTVAESIKSVIPKNFLAIRYGGDEFVVIGPKATNNKNDYMTKIKEDLKLRTKIMSLPYELSASMGAKTFLPNEKSELLQAIEEVDEIMYKNKTQFHKENKL